MPRYFLWNDWDRKNWHPRISCHLHTLVQRWNLLGKKLKLIHLSLHKSPIYSADHAMCIQNSPSLQNLPWHWPWGFGNMKVGRIIPYIMEKKHVPNHQVNYELDHIAIENGNLWLIYPLKIVIFHSYVCLFTRGYIIGKKGLDASPN